MPQNVVQIEGFGLYSTLWGDCRRVPLPFPNKWDRWRSIANELRLPRAARSRLEWMIWYETTGRWNARLTCRHFGIPPKTFYKWRRRFDGVNLLSLDDCSRRPHRTRRSPLSPEQEVRIAQLRRMYLHYSKMKLAVLYRELYGEPISSWQVQRVIRRHRLYPNPKRAENTAKKRRRAVAKKRITDLVSRPQTGFLFGIDTVVLWLQGTKRYVLTAIDRHSRLAFARMYTTHSSLTAADFLRRLYQLMGEKLVHIQTDNGSEFHRYFEQAIKDLKLQHWWNRNKTPKDNAVCERFNRTIQEEFIGRGNGYTDPVVFNQKLTNWLIEYNFRRPHFALGYRRPIEVACPDPKVLHMYSSLTASCALVEKRQNGRDMARLILQDGSVFEGEAFGATQPNPMAPEVEQAHFGAGEVVFNTGMVGYPESLTDPSYRGQILVFTYPLIGNYGVPSEEHNHWGFSENFESEDVHVRAIVCAQVSLHTSHHLAVSSLPMWLEQRGIPGLTGVDTRALTQKLREHGVMLGRIVQGGESCHGEPVESMTRGVSPLRQAQGDTLVEDPNLRNLVAEVSCAEVITYEPMLRDAPPRHPEEAGVSAEAVSKGSGAAPQHDVRATVIAYDCGMKRNILRFFLRRGVRVIRVPWNFDLSSCDLAYDGVFCSNGPGDPKRVAETIRQIGWAIEHGKITFGICLGIQLMALAIGGDTYKMKYGHRGANQPCTEEGTSRCIITSQNHGFAVREESLPKGWRVWFRNANDGTVEGIRHTSGRFTAVQFHPEASPGPEDAGYLFDEFLSVMRDRK